MAGDLTFTNAEIVTATEQFRGSLRVEDGRIVAVDRGNTAVRSAEDLDGDLLIPGLIELHTDNLERHIHPRPGVQWPALSAAIAHDAQIAGTGITTVFDALALIGGRQGQDRRQILQPMVDGLRRAAAAGMLRAEHFLHLRCEVPDEALPRLLEPFRNDPLLRLLSLMDHTPGQRQFMRLEVWRDLYQKLHGYTDAELEAMKSRQLAAQATLAPAARAEVAALGRARGLPMASHDDATLEHVAEAVSLGVTISEFPTTLEAAQAARAAGMAILIGAPNLVRGGSHSGNLAAADLARADLLDVLSSDYVPVSMLHGAFLLAGDGFGWPLPKALATITANPARAGHLADRGELEVGRRADLVRICVLEGQPVVRGVWREGRRVA